MCFVTTATAWVKTIVRMGLDVTNKLLCKFAMALGNDGLTHQYHQLILLETVWECYVKWGGSLIKDNLKTPYTFFKLVV